MPILQQVTRNQMNHRGLDDDDFVGQIADAICDRGLRLPALIGLEASRPFSLLGGQILWLLQPALGLLISRQAVGRFARLLEEPSAVEDLINQLGAREC